MPTFKLSDNLGFSTDIQAGPGALSRYFQNLPDWLALAINLKQFKDTTWDDPSVVATHSLLSFNKPVNIQGQAVALKVGAGVNGTLSIFVPAKDNDALFNPDFFGDNIPVRLGRAVRKRKLPGYCCGRVGCISEQNGVRVRWEVGCQPDLLPPVPPESGNSVGA